MTKPTGRPRGRPRTRPEMTREEAVRASNLWSLYKIRPEEYDAMREAQGYRCPICRRHEDDIPVRAYGRPRKDGTPKATAAKLVLDHCHTTLRRRALLCQDCNVGLGAFAEDPDRLRGALRYLADQAQHSPV